MLMSSFDAIFSIVFLDLGKAVGYIDRLKKMEVRT